MANYSVVTYKTSSTKVQTVLDELETKLETIDEAKTIRLLNVVYQNNSFVGVLIYDA